MNKESNDYNENKPLSGKDALVKSTQIDIGVHKNKVKFEILGEEVIEKIVMQSGYSGRIYLPPAWVGHTVKIVRIERS